MATYLGSVTGLSDPHQHGSGHLDGASRSVWQRTPSTPAAVVQLVLLSGRAGEATRRIFAFTVSPVTSSRSSPDEPQAAHGHKASQAPPGVETVLSGWRDGRLLGKSMSPSPPRAAPAHGAGHSPWRSASSMRSSFGRLAFSTCCHSMFATELLRTRLPLPFRFESCSAGRLETRHDTPLVVGV